MSATLIAEAALQLPRFHPTPMREHLVLLDGNALQAILERYQVIGRKKRIKILEQLQVLNVDVPSNKSIENAYTNNECTERTFRGLIRLFLALDELQSENPATGALTAEKLQKELGYAATHFGLWELDRLKQACRDRDVDTLSQIALSLKPTVPVDFDRLLADAELAELLAVPYYDDVRDARGLQLLTITTELIRRISETETRVEYAKLLRAAAELAYRYKNLEVLRDCLARLQRYGNSGIRTIHHSPSLDTEIRHFLADYGNIFDFEVCQQLQETAKDHPDRQGLANIIVKSHHCTACTKIREGKLQQASEALTLARREFTRYRRGQQLTPQQVHLRSGYILLLEAKLESHAGNPKTQRQLAEESAFAFESAKRAGFDHLMAKGYAYALLSDAEETLKRPTESFAAAYAALFQFHSCPYTFSCLFDYVAVLAQLKSRVGAVPRKFPLN